MTALMAKSAQSGLKRDTDLEGYADARIMRMTDIVSAISYALDLTEGQPPGHCLRCCAIGLSVGKSVGLTQGHLSNLYYTILLKDAGCSSNAARLWELYGGDDREIKNDFKTTDSQSLAQMAKFILRHAGPGEALKQRLKRVLHITYRGRDLATELVRSRCERGADIARQCGFNDAVALGIQSLDEHWNGNGRPNGLHGITIPIEARIALLAQVADVFHSVGGPERALKEIQGRAGTWFDPELVAAFKILARRPGFWQPLVSPNIEEHVRRLEPETHVVFVDENRLDTIANAFAQVVDAKSTFTSGHSHRVAAYADTIALHKGLAPNRRRWLKRGALLHDVGKLGVSNSILDKPGRLTEREWISVRAHARLSEDIIGRIAALADIAPIAGAHHERLDGKGYPRGLASDAIGLETRIITVADIFDALTAQRPYRDAMPLQQALAVMTEMRGTAIDEGCLAALKAALSDGTIALSPRKEWGTQDGAVLHSSVALKAAN